MKQPFFAAPAEARLHRRHPTPPWMVQQVWGDEIFTQTAFTLLELGATWLAVKSHRPNRMSVNRLPTEPEENNRHYQANIKLSKLNENLDGEPNP